MKKAPDDRPGTKVRAVRDAATVFSHQDEVLGKVFDSRIYARLAAFVRPHWRWLALALVLIPLVTAVELLQPYIVMRAINDHIAVKQLDGLGWLALVYVGLVFAQSLLGYVELYALQYAGQLSTTDLRVKLHKHVLSRRASFFDTTPVGRVVTRLTGDVDNLQEMFASGLVAILADGFKLVGIVVILLTLNFKLALLTLLVIPVLAATVEYFRRKMRTSYRQVRQKIAELNTYLQEHVTGMKIVQLFAKERAVAKDFAEINAEHRDATLAAVNADSSLYAVVEAISAITVALILWYAGGGIVQKTMSFGLMVAFIEYMNKFFIPVRDLSAKWGVMQAAMASGERIMALFDVSEEDAPSQTAAPSVTSHASDAPARTLAVEFSHITFGYQTTDPVLHDVSVRVEKGHTVAVVGATGSGKSTLIKLLTRLYEPSAGEIRLFGQPIAKLDKTTLRQRVTVVPQDVFLFSGTVRANLALGVESTDDTLLRTAIERVGFDKVLARRPQGIDALIAERGANFSLGERQLLAFARALARDPEVLVLDEATASVDPDAEASIETALAELMKDRTCLVIAHRLSTIRRADRIVVLHRGQVVEEGTHDELVRREGKYAKLYELSRQTRVRAAG